MSYRFLYPNAAVFPTYTVHMRAYARVRACARAHARVSVSGKSAARCKSMIYKRKVCSNAAVKSAAWGVFGVTVVGR